MSDIEKNSNKGDPETPPDLNDNRTSVHDTYPLISPIAAAFLGLIGGFFLYQFVGGILTLVIFGFDLDNAPINSLRLMTMAGQILFLLLPALLFAKWIYGDVSDVISIKMPEWIEIILFSAGIIILTPLLQSYLYIQNYFIEELAANSEMVNSIKSFFDSLNELVEKTYGNMLKADSIPEMFLVILIIAVVPAISEEVMFRGYIQKSFPGSYPRVSCQKNQLPKFQLPGRQGFLVEKLTLKRPHEDLQGSGQKFHLGNSQACGRFGAEWEYHLWMNQPKICSCRL